jgi:hypothetical protein
VVAVLTLFFVRTVNVQRRCHVRLHCIVQQQRRTPLRPNESQCMALRSTVGGEARGNDAVLDVSANLSNWPNQRKTGRKIKGFGQDTVLSKTQNISAGCRRKNVLWCLTLLPCDLSCPPRTLKQACASLPTSAFASIGWAICPLHAHRTLRFPFAGKAK